MCKYANEERMITVVNVGSDRKNYRTMNVVRRNKSLIVVISKYKIILRQVQDDKQKNRKSND